MTDRRVVGWYVEIPRTLREKFDALYPGRRNKKILTITAIQHAIDRAPKSLYNLYKEKEDAVESAPHNETGSSSGSSGDQEAQSGSGEYSSEPDPAGN